MPQVLQDGGSAVLVDFEDGRQPRWIPRAQWEQMNGGATPSPAEITMGPNNAQEPIYQDDATGVSISPVTTVPDPAFVPTPQPAAAPIETVKGPFGAPVPADAITTAPPPTPGWPAWNEAGKKPSPLSSLGRPDPNTPPVPEAAAPAGAPAGQPGAPAQPGEAPASAGGEHLAQVGKTAQDTIDNAIAGTRGATQMGVDAINKEAAAKAKQAEDEAKAWDETIQKNAGIEEAFSKVDTENRQRVLDSWNDTKAAADKYAAMEIDPDRYVNGRSTFQKIMMGISVVLGAGAQVAMGRNAQGGMAMPTNPGIDIINDAIDKDVQLQIASINKAGKVVDMRRNLFADARLIAGDDQDRYKLLVAAEQRRVANGLNAIGAKHASPIVKAQADKAAAALILDSNKTMADLAYKGGMLDARDAAIAARGMRRGGGSGGGGGGGSAKPGEGIQVWDVASKSFKPGKYDPETMVDLSDFGGQGFLSFGDKVEKRQWAAKLEAAGSVSMSQSKIVAGMNKLGLKDRFAFLRSEEGAALLSEYAAAFNKMRIVTNSGASFTDTEQKLIDDAELGDPTAVKNLVNNKALVAKMEAAMRRGEDDIRRGLKISTGYSGDFQLPHVNEETKDDFVGTRDKVFRGANKTGFEKDKKGNRFYPETPDKKMGFRFDFEKDTGAIRNEVRTLLNHKVMRNKSAAERKAYVDAEIVPGMKEELKSLIGEYDAAREAYAKEKDPAKKDMYRRAYNRMYATITNYGEEIRNLKNGTTLKAWEAEQAKESKAAAKDMRNKYSDRGELY